MDTRVLTPHVWDSVRAQSALLDHEPVYEHSQPVCGYSEWVCVHGWCMPVQFWHILCMWCMFHNKVYSNRSELSAYHDVLHQANAQHVALQNNKGLHIQDIMFSDVYTWVTDQLDHDVFVKWFDQIVQVMET